MQDREAKRVISHAPVFRQSKRSRHPGRFAPKFPLNVRSPANPIPLRVIVLVLVLLIVLVIVIASKA